MSKQPCIRIAATDKRSDRQHIPSYVCPNVRGKAGAAVEFGTKVTISLEDGYSRIEKLLWGPFNEAGTFEETVERYRERHGCHPEAVLEDRIYRNRAMLYYKKHQIRLSRPRLGRLPASSSLQKAEKRLERLDASSVMRLKGNLEKENGSTAWHVWLPGCKKQQNA